MSDLTNILTRAAFQQAEKQGLQVFVKTNLTPRLKVYDATEQGDQSPSLLQVGVEVVDNKGNVVTKYGGNPATNYALAGAAVSIVAAITFFTIRGIVK